MTGFRGFIGLCAVVCGLVWAGAVAAQVDLDIEVARGNRTVELDWSAAAEVDDPLFAGYKVWRSITPDPAGFLLLREFRRRYPVTWTFCQSTPFPVCDSPVGARREFVDPDSTVILRKVQAPGRLDSLIVRDYIQIPPHNGFPYHYAVTWMSECVTARNDTMRIDQPQPEFFSFFRGDDELEGFVGPDGDTLVVERVDCRRIDPLNNQPTSEMYTVYRGSAEAEEALRLYAVESTETLDPIFPSAVPRRTLQLVRAIPNPYEFSAPWDQPGEKKIQFINLTERATVRVYTASGDLVREIEHPNGGSAGRQGSADWDLRNDDGRLVSPGIYIYQVESPDNVVTFEGRLIIIR